MPPVITLQGIDQTIDNLNYRNSMGSKSRLLKAIRSYYGNVDSVETLQEIDTDALIKILWNIEDDPVSLKNRRKNLSSLRSSINTDLKKLYKEKKNPEGITISPFNTFVMSDEAKDNALEALQYSFTEGKESSVQKLREILNSVKDLLSDSRVLADARGGEHAEGLRELKDLIRELSGKVGLGIPPERVGLGVGGPEGKGVGSVFPGDEVREDAGNSGTVDRGEYQGFSEKGQEKGLPNEGKEGGARPSIEEELADLEEVEAVEAEGEEEIGEEAESEEVEVVEEALETEEVEIAPEEVVEDGDLEEVVEEGEMEESEGEEDPLEEVLEEEVVDGAEEESETVVEDELDAPEDFEEDPEDAQVQEDLEVVEIEGEEDEGLGLMGKEDLEEVDSSEKEGEGIERELGPSVDPGEISDDFPEASSLAEAESKGGLLEESYGSLEESGKDRGGEEKNKRLLSEQFNRSLAAMDKFFNQYVLIPRGNFTVGNETPKRLIPLEAFYMGKFPVTNALFEIFIEKTGYKTTAEKEGYGMVYCARVQRVIDEKTGLQALTWGSALLSKRVEGACWYQPLGPGSTLHKKRNHPVVQVSLEDATAFAAWTGKRLPTEEEWEAAARTSKGYIFPWGKEWKQETCNTEDSLIGDTTSVDAYRKWENEFGIADSLGNVLEWTTSPWNARPNKEESIVVAKGGSWISQTPLFLWNRFKMEAPFHSNILGFRCVAY